MAKEVIDYEIREDLDDNGNPIFDVYEQYVGDSEFVEAFQSREDAEKAIMRLKAENSRWLVLQAEDQDIDGGIWLAATTFDSIDDAKEFARKVIREEWAPRSVITTPDGVRNLADMPGYTHPPESVKWSKIHYSEDGMEAWYADRVEHIYRRLTICKVGKNGERIAC